MLSGQRRIRLLFSLANTCGLMVNVGANIYYWGAEEQKCLLQQALCPWAHELKSRALAQWVWYCPFDVRGPHIFMIAAAHRDRESGVRAFFENRIGGYLQTSPSRAALSLEEVSTRHRQCRGKTMNSADHEPGLAANNSFSIFQHGDDEYPLRIFGRVPDSGKLWRHVDAISAWTMAGGDKSGTAMAVQWLSTVQRSLLSSGMAADYWRFHAATLLPGLAQSWERDRDAVLGWLPRSISEATLKALAGLWNDTGEILPVPMDDLLKSILVDGPASPAQKFRILREINHTTLLQLGQMVAVQVPMILYAWQRSL